MNETTDQGLTTRNVRLGVRGLPNLTDTMVSGGLYVLLAETPTARFPVLASSLSSAIKEHLFCTVITPSNPEMFIQRLESFGNFEGNKWLASNQLQCFVMQDEFSKKIFRFGADSFVDELAFFEIPRNSFLVFDQADELLSLHDMTLALDQIDVLRTWFFEHQVTALLVFSRMTEAHANTINALMDSMTGIARLGANKDGLELTFDYWQSSEGTIAVRNYRLSMLESGLYEASTQASQPEPYDDDLPASALADPGPAQPHYFYMDPDLARVASQMPGVWQQVDTLVGMMHATRNTRSATAILSFQRDTNLRQLAETVHTLRLSLGRRAQIVVQEKGASLRYQNEALLLRLGLNMVVNRDVPASRLPLLLESLTGQVFNRDVDINFEAALASVSPTRLCGYLPPARFAREVETILNRSETLNIPCALFVGKPGRDLTILDIVTNHGLSRPGDLMSADLEYCFIFLNACPQSVVLATLERILGTTVEAAFDEIRFIIQREEVQSELLALAHAAEHGQLPDYSPLNTPQAETTHAQKEPGLVEPPIDRLESKPASFMAQVTKVLRDCAPAKRPMDHHPQDQTPQQKNAPARPLVDLNIKRPSPAPQAARELLPQTPAPRASQPAPAHPIQTSTPLYGKTAAPRATRSSSPKNTNTNTNG